MTKEECYEYALKKELYDANIGIEIPKVFNYISYRKS